MVDPDSHRISSVPWYSGTYSHLSLISLTGVSPSMLQLPSCVQLSVQVCFIVRPTTLHKPKLMKFRLFPVRSHYYGNLIRFLFLQVLRFFNSLSSLRLRGAHKGRVSPFGNPRIKACLTAPRGLSQPYYVLHRLLMPRHPPCTLSSLIN
jgi:hypothetical protein